MAAFFEEEDNDVHTNPPTPRPAGRPVLAPLPHHPGPDGLLAGEMDQPGGGSLQTPERQARPWRELPPQNPPPTVGTPTTEYPV